MDRVTMAHGAGGTIMSDLIKNHVLKYLGGSSAEIPLEALDDSAVVDNIVLPLEEFEWMGLQCTKCQIATLNGHERQNILTPRQIDLRSKLRIENKASFDSTFKKIREDFLLNHLFK